MLREEDKLTEALIQIIQSLPETKRKRLTNSLTAVNSKMTRNKKTTKRKMEAFIAHMKKTRSRLPVDYKFNREEANER